MKQCQCCGDVKEPEAFPLPIGWVLEQGLSSFCLTCLEDLAAMGAIPHWEQQP